MAAPRDGAGHREPERKMLCRGGLLLHAMSMTVDEPGRGDRGGLFPEQAHGFGVGMSVGAGLEDDVNAAGFRSCRPPRYPPSYVTPR